MAITIKRKVKAYTDLAFDLLDELLKAATFRKVIGYTVDPFSGTNVSVYETRSVDIFGRTTDLKMWTDRQSCMGTNAGW